MNYAIALHVGVSNNVITSNLKSKKDVISQILKSSTLLLQQEESAIDVVEKAIILLEDSGLFNAGSGSVKNRDNVIEMDASIMDGQTLRYGATAGISSKTQNPISLSRKIMDYRESGFLFGQNAEKFDINSSIIPIISEQPTQKKYNYFPIDKNLEYSTVGVVVMDSSGNLAAGTSTGGIPDKIPGRIGDSAIIGAGTYANNKSCAISCTGQGEEFIRHSIAHDISSRMLYAGNNLLEATSFSFDKLENKAGGVIAVDHRGSIVTMWNTEYMGFGVANSGGLFEVKL